MKIVELKNKLMTAARLDQPSDHVPYAFEKRIMARLEALKKVDSWSLWGHALWRAAAPCVALTVFLGLWTFHSTNSRPAEMMSADLEKTVLAPLDSMGDNW